MGRNFSSKLEVTVKDLLRDRALSMRQLASLTGINVATISKMLTGKQRVNPVYLQKMAYHLAVPPALLFSAAGFDVENFQIDKHEDTSIEHIQEILQRVGFQTHQFNRQSIEQELMKYDGYARTNEGHELIVAKFPEKRKQISGSGPFLDDLDQMFHRYLQSEVSEEERVILGSGLLYFVLSTDAIPDFMFPIGYLDDALAIQITRDRLSSLSS
jgi:uncharacterized membrane protein YkvA (DUF1232 family)/DNA-binding Xre family transcriptional regulator